MIERDDIFVSRGESLSFKPKQTDADYVRDKEFGFEFDLIIHDVKKYTSISLRVKP